MVSEEKWTSFHHRHGGCKNQTNHRMNRINHHDVDEKRFLGSVFDKILSPKKTSPPSTKKNNNATDQYNNDEILEEETLPQRGLNRNNLIQKSLSALPFFQRSESSLAPTSSSSLPSSSRNIYSSPMKKSCKGQLHQQQKLSPFSSPCDVTNHPGNHYRVPLSVSPRKKQLQQQQSLSSSPINSCSSSSSRNLTLSLSEKRRSASSSSSLLGSKNKQKQQSQASMESEEYMKYIMEQRRIRK